MDQKTASFNSLKNYIFDLTVYRTFVILLSLLFLNLYCLGQSKNIDPSKITIARDTHGLAHIFANTDAEVAFGLAWANAEDDFSAMQELLIITKQLMGRKNGKDGAAYDFFVHSLGLDRTYKQKAYAIRKAYYDYLEGYCQGINKYAALHPEQVLIEKAFPIVPEDIIKAYVVGFSALSGAVDQLKNIMNGTLDKSPISKPVGSNAYAVNNKKSKDGKTYLAINPHFNINGPFSFYEAHLHSDQGLNVCGAMFQGGSCVFMGNNQYLGWGKTYNHIDQVDVFELKMHTRKKHMYEYDLGYLKLEKRPVWLKVKIAGIVIPVKKMTYWSEFGPTYRSPNNKFYAMKSPAFFNLRAGEQYYRMNKATSFKEFKKALELDAHSMFNLVYADRDGNIMYLCNGSYPKRNLKYDYSQVIQGTMSEANWKSFYSLDEKPQVVNPDCGYVFNTNNTPLHASCKKTNFEPDLIAYADLRSGENNRSTRFESLIQQHEKIDFEFFKAIKFDSRIAKNTVFWKSLDPLFKINPEEHPAIEEAIKMIQNWSGETAVDNDTAALFMLSLQNIFEKHSLSDVPFTLGIQKNIPVMDYLEAIELASAELIRKTGGIRANLIDILFHKRNGQYHPTYGFPDAMSPIYVKRDAKDKLVADYADTYIHFVKFNKFGPELIQTLLPFKTFRTAEKYKDELNMFNQRTFKTIKMNKLEVMKNAIKIYHPE